MDKNKKNIKQEDTDIVHLPVLFGIKPGKYLAALYSFVLLVILFFVLFFPGLSKPGGKLVVQSRPEGAAVRIDDVYYDSTPCAIFVPKGKHDVAVVMEGFNEQDKEIDVKGRVFASVFAPETIKLDVKLDESSPLAALKSGAQDYAAWTFAGEPTEAYQVPLSLSEGAYRSAPEKAEDAMPVLEEAAQFMVTKAAMKDLLRSVFLAHNGGNAASPIASLAALRGIFDYLDNNRAFAVALTDLLGEESSKKLIESGFFPQVWADDQESGEIKAPAASSGKNIELSFSNYPLSVESIDFSPEFLPNYYTQNTAFQHEVRTGAFFISLNEITQAQYERFLNENPNWRRDNLDALIKEGYVDEDYLLLPEDDKYPRPSQGAVSYYAARAFCDWLTKKLPANLRSYKVRLPTEAEWEFAAKLGSSYFKNAGFPGANLKNMSGGLWEWCDEPFVPLNYLKTTGAVKGEPLELSPERGVRGGSWINSPGEIIPETRASLPPSICSPFVGFRVVLVPR